MIQGRKEQEKDRTGIRSHLSPTLCTISERKTYYTLLLLQESPGGRASRVLSSERSPPPRALTDQPPLPLSTQP